MKAKGFSLIELLLVMVIMTVIIMSSTIYMTQRSESMRINKTVAQMHYILNAGLAFYVANGRWPGPDDTYIPLNSGSASELQPDYLPPQAITGQFGTDPYYYVGHLTTDTQVPANTFAVAVYIGWETPKIIANGRIIAGRLPHGIYDVWGYVFAAVDVPGQNLSNATSVNFAGLYHHGGCVPVPTCPSTTALDGISSNPQVFVLPVSVSGVNDQNSSNVYPISSFTAFATDKGATPDVCPGADPADNTCAPLSGSNTPVSKQYWRVCLQVISQRGDVQATRTDEWGDRVTLAAFTRCNISNEPAGSNFNVFSH